MIVNPYSGIAFSDFINAPKNTSRHFEVPVFFMGNLPHAIDAKILCHGCKDNQKFSKRYKKIDIYIKFKIYSRFYNVL